MKVAFIFILYFYIVVLSLSLLCYTALVCDQKTHD